MDLLQALRERLNQFNLYNLEVYALLLGALQC